MFICSRSEEDIKTALEQLRGQGYAVHGCVADVSVREQCTALLDQVGGCRPALLTWTPVLMIRMSMSDMFLLVAGQRSLWRGAACAR